MIHKSASELLVRNARDNESRQTTLYKNPGSKFAYLIKNTECNNNGHDDENI